MGYEEEQELFIKLNKLLEQYNLYEKIEIANSYLHELMFYMTEEQRGIYNEINYTKALKIEAVRKQDFELAANLRNKEKELLNKLEETQINKLSNGLK